jgi:hypothetical protein
MIIHITMFRPGKALRWRALIRGDSFKYLLVGSAEEKRLFFADDYCREDQ